MAEVIGAEIGSEIGAKLLINYGPRIFKIIRVAKVEVKLHFALVFQFYSREDYHKVFVTLSSILDGFRIKESNKHLLRLQDINFEYSLSITHEQDYAVLGDILEDLCGLDPLRTTEEAIQTTILASSARLFLWPTNLSHQIDHKIFRNILESAYEIYRSINSSISEEMKVGRLGATKTRLFVTMILPDQEKARVEKFSHEKAKNRINVVGNKVQALIDDSSIIELLMQSLRR